LVFVASCHSESTGKIFKDAGAVHVICIRDNYEILDSVCQEFARIFYCSCINDKMSICDAFNFAKKQINLSHKFTSH
jgi:Fe2+ or Zn2+ uptake regulation protein